MLCHLCPLRALRPAGEAATPDPGQALWEIWLLRFLILILSKTNAEGLSWNSFKYVPFFSSFCKKEIWSFTYLILQHNFPWPNPKMAGLRGSSPWGACPRGQVEDTGKQCSVASQLLGPKGQHGHTGPEDQLATKTRSMLVPRLISLACRLD